MFIFCNGQYEPMPAHWYSPSAWPVGACQKADTRCNVIHPNPLHFISQSITHIHRALISGVIARERQTSPLPPSIWPPQKWSNWVLGLKRCAIFWTVCKNNFPIFWEFLFNTIFILSFRNLETSFFDKFFFFQCDTVATCSNFAR